jgi:hypothetical protein
MHAFSIFKKLLAPILVLTLSVSFFSSVATQAATKDLKINKKNISELNKTLQNIRDKDPQKPISQKLEKNSKDQNELNSNQSDNLQVKFSLRDKKVNLKNKNKGDLSIGIPNSESFDSVDVVDNKVIYSGQNSKTDVILESIEGGFRQIINIKDATAPNFYDFPVDLGEGETLSINDDGSAVVKKLDGSTKLGIVKPWAVDKNKKQLNTWYTIENSNVLRQNIELKDAGFPVVADPTWCGDFFSKVVWENRPSEGGITLRNYPTWCARSFDTGYGFDEIINKAPANSAWPSNNRNYTSNQGRSMYNQYRCHTWFVWWFKESYNLEPWRPLVDWKTMITRNLPYACNP